MVSLNRRCNLMVVLRLNSPDFATWSMALRKHVVSDVIQRLSTVASLALSTLTPMFFHSLWPIGKSRRASKPRDSKPGTTYSLLSAFIAELRHKYTFVRKWLELRLNWFVHRSYNKGSFEYLIFFKCLSNFLGWVCCWKNRSCVDQFIENSIV